MTDIKLAFVFTGKAMTHVARCYHILSERLHIKKEPYPTYARLVINDLALDNSKYQTKLEEFYLEYKNKLSMKNKGM